MGKKTRDCGSEQVDLCISAPKRNMTEVVIIGPPHESAGSVFVKWKSSKGVAPKALSGGFRESPGNPGRWVTLGKSPSGLPSLRLKSYGQATIRRTRHGGRGKEGPDLSRDIQVVPGFIAPEYTSQHERKVEPWR